ncbi:glycosyltransferase family 2 protein [Tundrisphaera lichenicola]|uniref:glycosyltransferase family 2 protein n=1 Tax=Tundrisphaera lichenicola TaxID=2029860 RepID=UPI003EBFB7AD
MEPEKSSDSPRPVLSVVIVNYRSWPDVLRLVESLDIIKGRSEVIVVDNASPEPIPEELLSPRDGVRVVVRSENGGFSAGVNEGWRLARGRWLLILNPDIEPGSRFLEQVERRINALRDRDRTGIIGFALQNPDGSRQPSVGVFPGLVRTAWEQLIPRDRRKYQPDWRLRPGPVDWVTGACLLVDSRLLDELGGMDEDFFLYHEEVALCRSAWDRGWAVHYDPSVAVVHLRPLQNRAISPKMRVITRHSKLLYFRKHLPTWQFAALCSIVQTEARIRGMISRLRGKSAQVRSWKSVVRVARLLRSGGELRGRAVLDLAEEAENPTDEIEGPPGPGIPPILRVVSNAQPRRPHGLRRLQPRKDGPA